jgi:WD domain, G-beta repeat
MAKRLVTNFKHRELDKKLAEINLCLGMIFLDCLRRLGSRSDQLWSAFETVRSTLSQEYISLDMRKLYHWLDHTYSQEEKHNLIFGHPKRQFTGPHLAASLGDGFMLNKFHDLGFPLAEVPVLMPGIPAKNKFTPLAVYTLYSKTTIGECAMHLFKPERPTPHVYRLAARRGRITLLGMFKEEDEDMFQDLWLELVRLAMAGEYEETVGWILEMARKSVQEMGDVDTVQDPLDGTILKISDASLTCLRYFQHHPKQIKYTLPKFQHSPGIVIKHNLPGKGIATHVRHHVTQGGEEIAVTVYMNGCIRMKSWAIINGIAHEKDSGSWRIDRLTDRRRGTSTISPYFEKVAFTFSIRVGADSVATEIVLGTIIGGESLLTRGIGLTWGELTTLAFSPNGETIAIASSLGRIILRDVTKKDAKDIMNQVDEAITDYTLLEPVFSPFYPFLACLGHRESHWRISLWNLESCTHLTILDTEKDGLCGNCFAFSPLPNIVAYGHIDGTVRVWDILARYEVAKFGRKTAENHELLNRVLEFSSDGRYIAESRRADFNDRSSILIWSCFTGALCWVFGDLSWVYGLNFSSDSKSISWSPAGEYLVNEIQIWRLS